MADDVVRIGLIADTHIPGVLACLPDSLGGVLAGVICILHAGDLVSLKVLDELSALAPTTAVCGNCDPPDVARLLAERAVVPIGGRRIGVHHGHQQPSVQNRYIGFPYDAPEFDLFYEVMAAQLPGCDVIVFGHFHAPVVREWRGILFVNPGSIAPPHARPTCAILELGKPVSARIELIP